MVKFYRSKRQESPAVAEPIIIRLFKKSTEAVRWKDLRQYTTEAQKREMAMSLTGNVAPSGKSVGAATR